jgi:2-dehydro-3-deoxyphosphogluconate aldolase / (4S)-4-hydroxy-2-oxoglutarate aldolase
MSIEAKQANVENILGMAPVVAVILIDDLRQAVPLARALVAGGLKVLEITLRTSAALEAIKAIKAEVEGAVVGAGTVLTPDQFRQCDRLGCAFAVSPGSTGQLLGVAEDHEMPLLPGAVTATEVMSLLEWGYRIQKFFPAEPAGGIAYLTALSSPIPQVQFCPTGGITPLSAPNYLKLPNVITVGGSWMIPKVKLASGDWAGIEALAGATAQLK